MNRLPIAIAILVVSSQAIAQEFRASVSGQVTDSLGATVAGAEVVATSAERNTPYRALSNAAGRYVLEFLPPGHYNLTAEKPGFKKLVPGGLRLEAAHHLSPHLTPQARH